MGLYSKGLFCRLFLLQVSINLLIRIKYRFLFWLFGDLYKKFLLKDLCCFLNYILNDRNSRHSLAITTSQLYTLYLFIRFVRSLLMNSIYLNLLVALNIFYVIDLRQLIRDIFHN